MKAPYSRTAYELLSEQASTAPDGMAVVYQGQKVTFSTLAESSGRLASSLRERGIKRGDRVGLLSHNRIEWLEIFFATTALGATLVPFSTWSTASELEFLINDSRIRCLFLIEKFGPQAFAQNISRIMDSGKVPDLEACVLIDGTVPPHMHDFRELRQGEPLALLPPGYRASASDPHVILYTSGSSKRPKAVPLDHFAAIENGFNIGERQGLVRADRVTSRSHCSGHTVQSTPYPQP